ncbi:hypothetical protein HMPREF3224_02054 [Anaerococcus hydrogenalis]|nr:hypothetical protein HMPREF3224_02054 [Anaerococcus hydrogenalis]
MEIRANKRRINWFKINIYYFILNFFIFIFVIESIMDKENIRRIYGI